MGCDWIYDPGKDARIRFEIEQQTRTERKRQIETTEKLRPKVLSYLKRRKSPTKASVVIISFSKRGYREDDIRECIQKMVDVELGIDTKWNLIVL